MWKWLEKMDSESSGAGRIMREFGRMLENGRHIFDTASTALLGGADPEVIRKDLFRTDKEINHLEREIRRELLVHVTVYGTSQMPQALVMMSIVKDAERIGDYCKNIFDLAVVKAKTKDDEYHGYDKHQQRQAQPFGATHHPVRRLETARGRHGAK